MGKKEKLALAEEKLGISLELNTLLNSKNLALRIENENLTIYKEMAMAEIEKLRTELAEFTNCTDLLINGFCIRANTELADYQALIIWHQKKLFNFSDNSNTICVVADLLD